MQDHLTVPGARLYHEVRGDGPLLLLISGGNGDTLPYARLAGLLADRFKVVTYERRGFSNSPLDGPPDDAGRLQLDVEDARRLIAHHGGGKARVFGSSSGAIVALELVRQSGDELGTVVAHEPPLVTLLPDVARWEAFFASVHAAYHGEGPGKAMQLFVEGIGLNVPGGNRPQPPGAMHNLAYWMDHELRQYPMAPVDLAALRAHKDHLVLACGRDGRETMPYKPNVVLGEKLGLPVVEFPGGHVGYATHPDAFAAQLTGLLGEVVM